MIGLKFEPRVSVGDIVMFFGLLASGLLAFAAMGERVSLVEAETQHNATAVVQVAGDLERHKQESAAADQALRAEIKSELRDINGKLDKLIERELDGRRR